MKRVLDFARNPENYNKEQIEIRDERNMMVFTNAKASAHDIEWYIIFGLIVYAVYFDKLEFALGVLILSLSRIFSFFYYLSKSNKQY